MTISGALPNNIVAPVGVAPLVTQGGGQGGMLSRIPDSALTAQAHGQLVAPGGPTQNQYAGDAQRSAAMSQIQDPVASLGASMLSQTSPWFGVNLGNALMQSSGSRNAGLQADAATQLAQAKGLYAAPTAKAQMATLRAHTLASWMKDPDKFKAEIQASLFPRMDPTPQTGS